VIATLLDRKLITTSGRKQVIGRPILYKTTKEFLMRFGLKDVNELPSMEEFEKLVAESFQSELIPAEDAAEAHEADSEQPEEIVESAAQKNSA
jgi:segregation and condensation protein B